MIGQGFSAAGPSFPRGSALANPARDTRFSGSRAVVVLRRRPSRWTARPELGTVIRRSISPTDALDEQPRSIHREFATPAGAREGLIHEQGQEARRAVERRPV